MARHHAASSVETEDLGFARVDHGRRLRKGFPEVIYGPGKTIDELLAIFRELASRNPNVIATRVDAEKAEAVLDAVPDSEYDSRGRILYRWRNRQPGGRGRVSIVTAGTSDLPVAREATITARVMGNEVDEIADVGVAGVHRLMKVLPQLESSTVIIAVAGFEGALPSVLGGLVGVPIIAVPTSVGYGTGLGGIAALLAMLNSCAPGIVVCNIDNGFGAAYAATLINRETPSSATPDNAR